MTQDTMIGRVIGGYRLQKLLGRGGMAVVYLAWDEKLQRDVAVKILISSEAKDETFVARFKQEALATARLDHPNIVHIYDFGRENDLTYMVMEYLPNGTLQDVLAMAVKSGRVVEQEYATYVVAQIARALDYAHGEGIIHRDIKPSNVMFAKDGRPILTDLGIAKALEGPKLTRTMTTVGTPAYMSPEQGRGEKVDQRSDLYSLGIVLYELLTGYPPYQAETPWGVVYQHVSADLPSIRKVNPDVPPSLAGVVEKALSKRPEDRFQTGSEMASALQSGIGKQDKVKRTQKRSSTWRILALGGVLGVALIVVAYMVFSYLSPQSSQTAIRLTAEAKVVSEQDTKRVEVEKIVPTATEPTDTELASETDISTETTPDVITKTPLPPTPTPTPSPTLTATNSPTLSPTLSPTADQNIEDGQLVRTRRGVNVRKGPGTGFPRVATAVEGQELSVIGKNSDATWWQIDFAGQEGWVSSSLVTAPSDPSEIPEVVVRVASTSTPSPTVQQPSDANWVLGFEQEPPWIIGDQKFGVGQGSSAEAAQGSQALRIRYDGLPGISVTDQHFIVLRRPSSVPVPGKPDLMTAQVYGDGSGHYLNVWLQDSDSEIWQFTFGQINHTGWHTLALPLDPNADWPVDVVQRKRNSKVDYPLRLHSLVLDSTSNQSTSGVIYLDDLRVADSTRVTNNATPQTSNEIPTTPPTGDVNLAGHIIYSLWDPGAKTYNIQLRNADGSAPRIIYQGATQPDFCLAPSNRIIANGTSAGLEGTIAIDLGVGSQEVIPNTGDTLPACSPEGKRVVFQSDREGSAFIWIHHDINQWDDKVSGKFYLGRYPTWSSRWQIIWKGCEHWAGNGGNCGIWQAPDGGGAPVQISTGGSDTAPDVSPNGSTVAYMSREIGLWHIFTAAATGGGNQQLTTEGNNGLPTWSPDGQGIAFVSTREGGWGLWVMNADGSGQRKIAALEHGFGQGPIDWTEQRISWGH